MRLLGRLLLIIGLALGAFAAVPAGPASADLTGECHWVDKGESTVRKVCSHIHHYFTGSKVVGGLSVYTPPSNAGGVSYGVSFKLKDTRADNRCTWVWFRKWAAVPLNVRWKVCGKGEEKIISFNLASEPDTAPGLVTLKHCERVKGVRICDKFARQRLPDPS